MSRAATVSRRVKYLPPFPIPASEARSAYFTKPVGGTVWRCPVRALHPSLVGATELQVWYNTTGFSYAIWCAAFYNAAGDQVGAAEYGATMRDAAVSALLNLPPGHYR